MKLVNFSARFEMAISCADLQRNSILILFFLTILLFACSGPIIIVLLIVGNIYIKAACLLYLMFYISGHLRKVEDRGGRRACQWVRNWGLWKWLLNYFPVDLVKTADLPPDRNYLVCIFPHGYFRSRLKNNMLDINLNLILNPNVPYTVETENIGGDSYMYYLEANEVFSFADYFTIARIDYKLEEK